MLLLLVVVVVVGGELLWLCWIVGVLLVLIAVGDVCCCELGVL